MTDNGNARADTLPGEGPSSARHGLAAGDSAPGDSVTAAALDAAVQALTQASQTLIAAATQLSRTSQAMGVGGATPEAGGGTLPVGPIPGVPPAQITVWEDDPFSEAVPSANPISAATISVDIPPVSVPPLRVAIVDPEPMPSRYDPGTQSFRYWVAAEALTRGVGFWAPLLPAGTRWSTSHPNLRVSLDAGQALNATYRRIDGLRFFRETVHDVEVFSAESSDIVCHELGHAVLDALRPELFHAASFEAAAFHEAFGDMASILGALQLPTLREKVLAETQGRLWTNSRLSRIAEQLGWAIRQKQPDAVDHDSLRNASNSFFYQQPERIPPSAPARELSSESHSFARVFTGAFLEALDGMLAVPGPNDASLVAVARDLGRLLVDGVLIAPIKPAYFSQVAAAMIKADEARNNGRYRQALSRAFIRRGILSPLTIPALDNAEAPHFEAAPGPPVREAAAVGPEGFSAAVGAPRLLTYGDAEADDGYRRGFEDAPELRTHAVPGDMLGLGGQLLVHAPDLDQPFAVASAAPAATSVRASSPEKDALYFTQELIRRGRVDLGPAAGAVASLSAPTEEKTHELVETTGGMVLKRIHFDCGLCCQR